MLERILVPLDGSTRAEAILTELRVLLARRDSEVVLLRVVLLPTTMNAPEYARLLDERRAEALAYVQRVVGELAGAGATARGAAQARNAVVSIESQIPAVSLAIVFAEAGATR